MTRNLVVKFNIYTKKKKKKKKKPNYVQCMHITYILGEDLKETFVSVTHRYCRISPEILK